ncbi:uncharacterized protein LOC126772957 [Nymphalis io]|uniref:uncharacterized protein LOC126772957 n=1 Tax=Inachis io TaxID=171585 RepID=UPI0021693B65|nr:uncharacterized protein LOC126772957 [Nymphalis io]
MTVVGRSLELADVLTKRRVRVAFLQETRWKGNKSRDIGLGYKLIYSGSPSGKNGVAVVLCEELQNGILEVDTQSDRLLRVKLMIEGVITHLISAYTPQVGSSESEKEAFWNNLEDMPRCITITESIVIGGDLNGHGHVYGGYGCGRENAEGDSILSTCLLSDLAIINTFFQKKPEHLITYKSGPHSTQIDYLLIRRSQIGRVTNCKVTPGACLTTQHRILVMDMLVVPIQEAVREKKTQFKKWQETKSPEDRAAYKAVKCATERAVAKVRYQTLSPLYDTLETNEGQKTIFRLAKATQDISKCLCVKDSNGTLVCDAVKVKERWRDYFNVLLNTQHGNVSPPELPPNLGLVAPVTPDEVLKCLRTMKNRKSVGPDDLPIEAWKAMSSHVYKGKGSVQDCESYRDIKVMCHTMKLFERVIDSRLRQECTVSECQYGFRPGCGTIDPILALRILAEAHREKKKTLYMAFLDLQKSYCTAARRGQRSRDTFSNFTSRK